MTSFPSATFEQTIIPVRLLVSETEEPDGQHIGAKPLKGRGSGPLRRAKANPAETSPEIPKESGMKPHLTPAPLDPRAVSEPAPDTSQVEIQTAETAAPTSFSKDGAERGFAAFGAGGTSLGDGGHGGGGSGNGRGSGEGTLARAYAKADYAHNPVPEYPERARRQGWEGTVLLDVLITREGKPEKIEIKQSSGFEILDKAAIQAVTGWRFQPARYGTTALEGWVKVPIVFRLSDKRN
ncbi:MAG: energy transducer TonB [Candidatus Binatia bacterium]